MSWSCRRAPPDAATYSCAVTASARSSTAARGRRQSVSSDMSAQQGYRPRMCRNIRPLYNFAPPASEDEIRASALQFVRKTSGFQKPSKANEAVFNRAIDEITAVTKRMIDDLVTNAPPKNRDEEAEKAKRRAAPRYEAQDLGRELLRERAATA